MKLYARYVPTNDETLRELNPKAAQKTKDVILSHEPNGAEVARFPWHYKSQPTPKTKKVLFNGVQFNLSWTD